VTTTVLSNDTDVEGDTLSVTSVTQGSHGSVVIVCNQVKYTPAANYNGSDSYTYTISDGNGGTDTATVNVTVDPVNDAPYAGDGAVTTSEDTNVIVDVAALTGDIDSGPLVITVTGGPTHGALVDNGDGTYTYQPDPDYFGPDTFTYQVCDADLACATGTIDITVTPVNDPPVAAGDSVSLFQDTPTVIDVLGNDSDADGDPLVTNVLSAPSHGSVVLNPDGTVTYTPDPGYIGPDSFSYEACDPASACDSATVTISVVDLPEPPVAKDDSATVSEDGSVGIDVLANDTDPENNIDPTAVTVTAGPTHGSTSVDPVTGVVTYTPDANFNGSDQFTYQVCDSGAPVQCDTADVLVTVDPVNDPPTAVDDSVTLNEDTSGTTVDVRGNDSDPESASSSLSVSLDVGPSHGSAVDNGDGTFTYTPDADYSGPDSFTYLLCDPSLACDVATVDVTVDPVNDPPVAVGDTVATNENTDVTVTVLGNDSDVDSVLTTAAGATVSVTGAPAHGSTTVNANGTVTYSPDPGYSGPDSFTYQVCDSAGGCDSAVVAVTVNGVNSNPVANDDAGATNEDSNVTVDVLTNDVDPEGQPLAVTSATNGGNGSTTVNADGTITYSPDAGWFGVDTFTYTISDGNGGSATATVTITVNSVNDSPVAKDNSVVTDEDTPVTTVDVTGNDTDPDGDPLTVTGHSPAAHGTVTDNGDGTFDYAPDADYFGPDAFTYTVSDGNGGTDTATVNVTVKPVNDAPLAQDDSATTNESQPVTVVVLGNDSDVDSPLTSAGGAAVTVTSGPGNGSVAVNGSLSVTYTPNPGFFGSDSFTYQVCDADGACDTATVDVTVVDNLAPLAVDDAASTNEDVPVTVDVVTNDSDPEGGALTVVSSTSPGHGVLVDNGDGTFTYTPAANWSGTDTFTYTVSDDLGNTATATVTVTVSAVNDVPKARHDADSTLEDTPVDITVLTNDTDPEGDTLTVVSAGSGSHGSTTVNGNGTVTYVPDSGWSGTDTFSYTISDGNGGTDTATVTVTVDAVNAAPSAVDDSAKTAEDHAVTIAVKANDSDPDGDPTNVTAVTQPSHGTTKVKGSQVVYTPDHNYNGADSFTYTLCDPFGACDVATVTVTVAPRNDAPVAKDDAIDAQAGQPVTIHVGANDHDVEGQPVTVTVVEQPSDGSAVVKPNGDIVFTADAGANGVQTFVYEICDPDGDCSQATVSVTVAGASVPAPAPVPSTPSQGGPLPHTGAEVTRLALWAASMLAMGAALLLGSAPLRLRRRD
ncbi:MAG: Ig-like domain-containing protein, partial [Actinomycetes bacterium]